MVSRGFVLMLLLLNIVDEYFMRMTFFAYCIATVPYCYNYYKSADIICGVVFILNARLLHTAVIRNDACFDRGAFDGDVNCF